MLELHTKRRIHHLFHMSLLEQDTITNRVVTKFLYLELNVREDKK